jgi:hypothetical protein
MQGNTVTQALARGIGRVAHAKTYDRNTRCRMRPRC